MSTKPILDDRTLKTFAERAPGYDAANRFFAEDFEDLKKAGYLVAPIPKELGGLGYDLEHVCLEPPLLEAHVLEVVAEAPELLGDGRHQVSGLLEVLEVLGEEAVGGVVAGRALGEGLQCPVVENRFGRHGGPSSRGVGGVFARTRLLPERQQHPHLFAIAAITLAELGDQVTLLEPDPDQDVPGRRRREDEVAQRHDRREPEREEEAEVDRVTDVAVEARRTEPRLRQLAAAEARVHLDHAEELEVADEE